MVTRLNSRHGRPDYLVAANRSSVVDHYSGSNMALRAIRKSMAIVPPEWIAHCLREGKLVPHLLYSLDQEADLNQSEEEILRRIEEQKASQSVFKRPIVVPGRRRSRSVRHKLNNQIE